MFLVFLFLFFFWIGRNRKEEEEEEEKGRKEKKKKKAKAKTERKSSYCIAMIPGLLVAMRYLQYEQRSWTRGDLYSTM